MTDSRLSISSISYKKKDDIRILNSCLSNWFSNPKILHFVSPSMRYPFKIQQWINQSYSNQSNTLVLKLDNWIIGHISIRINNQKKSAHIFHLIIDPAQQQKGYGKQLISHAEELIIKNNLKKITINVLIKNQIAKNFYEKSGFIVSENSKSGKIKMLKNLEE
tara:strand:+ start:589 stop:1077 length:489 start_codon:yes stop_codon:yes gene_type:complete